MSDEARLGEVGRAPLFSADWHAWRAEQLVSLAGSASMWGWWRRRRRQELLAAALVHATLGAAATRVERPLWVVPRVG